MNAFERLWVKLSFLLGGGTGLVYGWLRYFAVRSGEFGPEPHRFQGLSQHLHVLLAPTLVFALGFLLRAHVLPRWRAGRPTGRGSGILLALVFAPMILSGYGVQVAVDPATRTALAWAHGISSLVALLAMAAHLARTWAEARRAREEGLEERL